MMLSNDDFCVPQRSKEPLTPKDERLRFMQPFKYRASISSSTTASVQIGMKVLMEFFFFNYLPSLRVPGEVYGWYRSDLSPACHQRGAQNAGGKTGAKLLALCLPGKFWTIG